MLLFVRHTPPGHSAPCDRPAEYRVEGYSPREGRLHGSLDMAVSACSEHHHLARRQWLEGLTPYSMEYRGPAGPCGESVDYRQLAPVPEGTAILVTDGLVEGIKGGVEDIEPVCCPWCLSTDANKVGIEKATGIMCRNEFHCPAPQIHGSPFLVCPYCNWRQDPSTEPPAGWAVDWTTMTE